ncbi:hypothetical protein CROQUDRAFT_706074 [Cronartium quercuum f. sp. fusiforme G11]|uniref:Smr domain-containing protein n=1 Tax=Cronartium quercuum f. sp. fusiforme G11 TaxID=708437 RepID=A0A9P6TG87_9BASI|nr:hypothetical protein CROQUDRAFT_706074 [Cronartium quercuum f. sp. fusiforme G11]
MKQKFDEAHQAYNSGARGRAKELSNQGKSHQRNRDDLNQQAANWIYKENNRHSPAGTIDLHGLYVQESISYTESFIAREQRKGGSRTLRVIVGKGIHSAHHAPKIKPAIENMVTKYNLAVRLDPRNAGVLLIDLHAGLDHRGIDRGLTERLDKPAADSCLLM